MQQESTIVYSVPTHLQEREPFAFGRTVGEIARLVVIGFVAARLVGSEDLPATLRFPAAGIVLLAGAGWALVRIQHRPLDGWLGLAFRYGASPRRRVWQPGGSGVNAAIEGNTGAGRGWYDLERVRVRWVAPAGNGGHERSSLSAALPTSDRGTA